MNCYCPNCWIECELSASWHRYLAVTGTSWISPFVVDDPQCLITIGSLYLEGLAGCHWKSGWSSCPRSATAPFACRWCCRSSAGRGCSRSGCCSCRLRIQAGCRRWPGTCSSSIVSVLLSEGIAPRFDHLIWSVLIAWTSLRSSLARYRRFDCCLSFRRFAYQWFGCRCCQRLRSLWSLL